MSVFLSVTVLIRALKFQTYSARFWVLSVPTPTGGLKGTVCIFCHEESLYINVLFALRLVTFYDFYPHSLTLLEVIATGDEK